MKIILSMALFMWLMAMMGCASERYSASSYQDRAALQQVLQEDPDYYHIWMEDQGR